MNIKQLKLDIAEMLGMSIEELGDPFLPNRKLPQPLKYRCAVHGSWWYPQNEICCPKCRKEVNE